MDSTTVMAEPGEVVLPDHTQLPDKDGAIVNNFHEHPQSNLLTDSLRPRLFEIHPDRQFCVGSDSGIYYRYTQPVLDGCKSPDWFYVPNVPPMLNGQMRRSYVMWYETVRPLLVIEYVSGDGSEEHDTTPYKGKFWVYEQGICATYYLIHDMRVGTIELYSLDLGRYAPVAPNAAGRFPVKPLGVEFGLWHKSYREQTLHWLRPWDSKTGKMLPISEERADIAESVIDEMRNMLNEATDARENERKRAERFAERLRAAGIDPASISE